MRCDANARTSVFRAAYKDGDFKNLNPYLKRANWPNRRAASVSRGCRIGMESGDNSVSVVRRYRYARVRQYGCRTNTVTTYSPDKAARINAHISIIIAGAL